MKISVVMCTARPTYPSVPTEGNPHLFSFTVDSLQRQTFKDFEFIVVDRLYDERETFFQEHKFSYPVKHMAPPPSVWVPRKMWGLCSARNLGIAHCEGDLVVFVDDTLAFEPDWLQKMWNWYEKGYFPLSLYKVKAVDGSPAMQNGKEIVDSRVEQMGSQTVYTHEIGDWFYTGAGAGASLQALLGVNGFDENFDGVKSLEDSDLGIRLVNAGHHFVMDTGLYSSVIDVHYNIGGIVQLTDAFKSNYPLLELNRDHKVIEVNRRRLTDEEVEFVRTESAKWNVPVNEEMLKVWLDAQHIFDLQELRWSLE